MLLLLLKSSGRSTNHTRFSCLISEVNGLSFFLGCTEPLPSSGQLRINATSLQNLLFILQSKRPCVKQGLQFSPWYQDGLLSSLTYGVLP